MGCDVASGIGSSGIGLERACRNAFRWIGVGSGGTRSAADSARAVGLLQLSCVSMAIGDRSPASAIPHGWKFDTRPLQRSRCQLVRI